eukprot:IDg5820t1
MAGNQNCTLSAQAAFGALIAIGSSSLRPVHALKSCTTAYVMRAKGRVVTQYSGSTTARRLHVVSLGDAPVLEPSQVLALPSYRA